MTPGKFPAGASLQIPLELERRFFFVELDDNQSSPGAVFGGVW
jgi:hypothetical protein